ncbi:type IV pilin-like G/H family protein [Coleofasciculus sp. FACHB-64]|uniref:type IV pilin-like G/H family protein n=1 Tax=Cyanophyceae TaxID=3028117 RepID=UPI0016842288|nr:MULTISPECIES: type IV pilin-like G/H family protein [unclassified Coleofasciculus]MBD1840716.1 type IV pilin-like G/H family protein [Coleofasciculus sp. FACHB-501]MBD2048254.1 type IV pilin-like G/H family protein [Coleofasciculus sp. FACHB-64]
MNKTILKLYKFSAGLPIFNKLIASSLLFGLLGGIAAIANAQVQNPAERARQAEPQQIMDMLNRAQQDFYREYGRFASKIEHLGFCNLQKSKNYGYIIFPPNDPTQSVLMVAKPFRPDLKMYSSGVFVTKTQDKSFTVAGVCETIKSVAIPGIPKYSNKGKSPIECPAGYQLVK